MVQYDKEIVGKNHGRGMINEHCSTNIISSMIESSRNTGTSMVQHSQLNLYTSESGFFECWSDAVTSTELLELWHWSRG